MNKTFPLTEDSALRHCEVKTSNSVSCHYCGDSSVPIYHYSGKALIDGKYEDVDELCSLCILSSSTELNYPNEYKSTLELCIDSELSFKEISVTPNLPCFIQGYDAPVCCGKICSFTGVRQEEMDSSEIPTNYKFWDKGFKDYWQIYDFTPDSEFSEDVGFFECRVCKENVFTFQFM